MTAGENSASINDGFDFLGQLNRPELGDAFSRFAGDARWPEYARAQRILS